VNKFKNRLRGLIAICLSICCLPLHADSLHIAAASNLRHIMPEIANVYTQKTGQYLAITYAASGTLTTQIKHGAPFDILMSAKADYINQLDDLALTRGEFQHYANALMVLFIANNSSLNIETVWQDLHNRLDDKTLGKIAMANPRHAPFGQLAQQELEAKGLWQSIQPHLLLAENAAQSVQFSLSSAVDAGFIPLSYALHDQVESAGKFIILESQIPQYIVVLKNAPESAEQFFDFMQTSPAIKLLEQQGFIVPKDMK